MSDSSDEVDPAQGRRALWTLMKRYWRGYRLQLAVGSTLALVGSLLMQLIPLFIGFAIDVLFNPERAYSLPFVPEAWLPAGQGGQLALTVGLVAAVYMLSAAMWVSTDALWGHYAQHLQHSIRTDTYEAAQDRDLAYFDDTQTGEVMSVLNNDVNKLEDFFTHTIAMAIRVVVMILGIALLMLAVHPQLALVTLSTVPVLIALAYTFEKRVESKYQEKRETVGELNGRLENNVGGIQTIKTYGTEREEHERVTESSAGYRDIAWGAFKEYVGFVGTVSVATNVGFLLTFAVGGWWLFFGAPGPFTGALTVGTLTSFLLYSQRFEFPMHQFAGVLDGYQNARAAAARVVDLLESEGDVTDDAGADALEVTDGSVTYEDVEFGYEGEDDPALRDVSFEAEPGEFVGLVGSTGAGKSTTMKLLPRLYDVDDGSIRVDGEDVRDVTKESLRDAIGYVSQEPYLFTGTVAENVAYGSDDVSREDVVAAATRAGAHEFVSELPDGYDTEVGERGVKLSGGQRQRVAIARALLTDPEILVLDEATSHVDNETEAIIQEHLSELVADRTTFAIAHRLSTVRHADTILVMDDGEIVERGTHEELLAADGRYAALWSVQVGDVQSLPDSFVERERAAGPL